MSPISREPSRRNLFLLASLTVVLLAGRGAFAERLGGSYRGPEDLNKVAKTESTGADTGGKDSGGGGAQQSGGGSDSGGASASGGSGDSGGSGGGGSGDSGGGSGSSSSGGDQGGPNAGGGGSSDGKSAGGGSGSTGGSSTGASAGGSGKKANTAQTQFVIASWYFEHNREQLFARYAEAQGRRFQFPLHCAVAAFGVLPRDARQRTVITNEDKEKIFDVLKKQLLMSDQPVVRDAAVIALGKLGTPGAVELLKAHVGVERDMAVKQDTLIALGLARSAEGVPILLDVLRADRSGKLTSYALLALGLSQDSEKAAPAVLEYFNANASKTEKEKDLVDPVSAAAVALGALKHADAVGPLASALNGKGVAEFVRCYCAQALGKIRGPAAQKALEDALAKGGLDVERAAAIALGQFGDVGVARLLAGKEGLLSTDGLRSGFAAVSLGRVLGQLDEEDWKSAPDELRGIALKPEKDAVKAQYANLALTFFTGGFDKDVREFYGKHLGDAKHDKDVQSALAMTAGLGGLANAQATLVGMAKDAGRNVYARSYSAMAIGMVGQSQAKDAVKELKDLYTNSTGAEDAIVRRGAILGLGFVGDRGDVPFLLNVIDQTKEEAGTLARYTRGAAVMALGMIRDGESISKIQELTGHNDPRTRAYALAALGYLADKDDVPAMAQLFEDANFRKEFNSLEVVMHQL